MKGQQVIASLPPGPTEEREQAILRLVKDGNVVVNWVPITVDHGGVRATFFVTSEPILFGEDWDDAVYLPVKPRTMQTIADWFGASLLTPKLVDEIWRNAEIKVDPFIATPAGAGMTSTARSDTYTALIKAKIGSARKASKSDAPLIANIGKYWTAGTFTAANPSKAENYGFFASGPTRGTVSNLPGVNAIQTVGHAHNLEHTDYSQLIMLVSRKVLLCQPDAVSGLGFGACPTGSSCEAPGGPGRSRCVDIEELARDPVLWPLVKHDGPSALRLPAVPRGPQGADSLPRSFSTTDLLATLFVLGSGVALGYLGYELVAKGALS